MKSKFLPIFVIAILSALLGGCDVGSSPPGSTEQAKKEYEDMPLQKKIDFINNSPMPPEQKAKYIKEAKEKAGQMSDGSEVKAPDPTGVTR